MKNYNSKDNSFQQTEWNGASLCVYRVNNIIIKSNYLFEASIQDGLDPRLLTLYGDTASSLFKEIAPKLSINEKKRLKEYYKKYKKLGSVYTKVRTKEGVITAVNTDIFFKKRAIINEFDMECRAICDKVGFLNPNKPSETMGDVL